ncbi:hypothetical protein ACFPYM_01335 [Methylobacterium hispanicum]|uniref:hypothetical protein n=1 Tax=Methylobacterium TaxID=407 RepID=UPI0018D2367C|nr:MULTISPECIES: hypothetical protein [Methylobacterium]
MAVLAEAAASTARHCMSRSLKNLLAESYEPADKISSLADQYCSALHAERPANLFQTICADPVVPASKVLSTVYLVALAAAAHVPRNVVTGVGVLAKHQPSEPEADSASDKQAGHGSTVHVANRSAAFSEVA